MRPIRLVWLVLAAALAWSFWWGWSAWAAKADLVRWMEARRAEGWQAEWSGISVAGYPNRIDLTVADPVLANTAAGWVWTAPFFQILRLSYDKDHVILVWPDAMTVQTPYERVGVSGRELRGSVTFRPGRARQVEEAVLVFRGLELSSDAGWTSSVEAARLAMRPAADAPDAHEIGLEITGLTPRAPAVARLADAGIVPGAVDRLTANLVVTFDRPWDRTALETTRPQPQTIGVEEMSAAWGRLELRVAGELAVDARGRPEGELLVKATNWQEILDVARQGGALPGALADTVEQTLRLLSGLAGSPKTLDIPLSFEDGRMRAGPVPLGAAPRIRVP